MTIKRPEVAQLDAIFATVAKIHRAEARLAALKEQVAQEARALAEIPDKRLRIEAGFYAYWFAPEVPATDIAVGATGRPHPARLMKLAGAVSIGIPCDRCQEDLPIRSRSQMKDILALSGGGPAPSGTTGSFAFPAKMHSIKSGGASGGRSSTLTTYVRRNWPQCPTLNTCRRQSFRTRETFTFGGWPTELIRSNAKPVMASPCWGSITR